MAIIPWLEKVVHGDKNFIRNIKQFGAQGRDLYDRGLNLEDEGLGGIRNARDAYALALRGPSVLPPQVLAAMKKARGMVADRNVRDIASTSARLGQARVAGRGKLSAEAAQEYLTEAESEANRAAHEAGVDIDTREAGFELQETNTLRDRLERAYELIIGTGQRRTAHGLAMQLASLDLRYKRNKAIADTVMGMTSIFYSPTKSGSGGSLGSGGFTG